jgi:hypothetical protein
MFLIKTELVCTCLSPLFQSHPIMFSIESAFPHLQFDSTTLLLHLTVPLPSKIQKTYPFQDKQWDGPAWVVDWIQYVNHQKNSTALAMAYNPQSILLVCFWTSGILTNNLFTFKKWHTECPILKLNCPVSCHDFSKRIYPKIINYAYY